MTDMSWTPDPKSIYEELASPKKDIRKGLFIAGAFFIGLLGWAAMTPLDAGAVAQGYVAVSGSRQAVQHREGGIVVGLNVVEGQAVKEGDLLVSISASDLVASERGMSGELVNLYAQRARLQAERDGSALRTPKEFASIAAEDKPLADEAFRGQQLLLSARREAMQSEQSVLGQRVQQHNAQIGAYQHQMNANRKQQVLITDELSGLKELEQRGFVSKNRVRMMERSAAELDGNYGAFNADIARSNEAIGESRMQMVSIRRQVLEGVATQLREVQVRIDEVQPRLMAAREQLKRAMVRAPATGRVVGLKVHTVGGVVAPGEMLMEIVPQDRALVVDAKASPSDADDLKVGMPTQVRFSSLQERNLPVLHGRVNKVSADSFEDERTGQRHFKIEVVVPPAELNKIKQVRGDIGIKAGLPADVFVPMRKRTALGYLLDPLTQMLWLSGREH
jgi:HlyD family type I secretion membrane fusion protein